MRPQGILSCLAWLKDEFTLLKLGTSIFFDNFESALEQAASAAS